LIDLVKPDVPRLLINMEPVALANNDFFFSNNGFDFSGEGCRDVFFQGKCDDAILQLATLLGWKEELLALQTSQNQKIDEKWRLIN
jgi:hypothetical protein